jgi:RNA polymerase sigma factor (sigma-70 family)
VSRAPAIDELLTRHAGLIGHIVTREAGVALLRFDQADDLVQGARQEVIRAAGSLEWRGEEAFKGWLATIVRRHLAARRDYWFACKRNPGALLRLTFSGDDGGRRERADLAASGVGPASFAQRREMLTLITKAVAMLLPRDRELVAMTAQGMSAAEVAGRVGLTVEAADRARQRALERLRKAFVLLSRGPSEGAAPPTPVPEE